MSAKARVSTRRQLGELESIGEQTAATTLDNGIDEQPILVDKSGLDQGVTERNAAADHDLQTLLIFQCLDLFERVSRQDCGVVASGVCDRRGHHVLAHVIEVLGY